MCSTRGRAYLCAAHGPHGAQGPEVGAELRAARLVPRAALVLEEVQNLRLQLLGLLVRCRLLAPNLLQLLLERAQPLSPTGLAGPSLGDSRSLRGLLVLDPAHHPVRPSDPSLSHPGLPLGSTQREIPLGGTGASPRCRPLSARLHHHRCDLLALGLIRALQAPCDALPPFA